MPKIRGAAKRTNADVEVNETYVFNYMREYFLFFVDVRNGMPPQIHLKHFEKKKLQSFELGFPKGCPLENCYNNFTSVIIKESYAQD